MCEIVLVANCYLGDQIEAKT